MLARFVVEAAASRIVNIHSNSSDLDSTTTLVRDGGSSGQTTTPEPRANVSQEAAASRIVDLHNNSSDLDPTNTLVPDERSSGQTTLLEPKADVSQQSNTVVDLALQQKLQRQQTIVQRWSYLRTFNWGIIILSGIWTSYRVIRFGTITWCMRSLESLQERLDQDRVGPQDRSALQEIRWTTL